MILRLLIALPLLILAPFTAAAGLPEALGKLVFNDASLSEPAGQSCNSCHDAKRHYADPENTVSPGADTRLFGNRNAPSISYIQFTPALYRDDEEQHWVGGFFLDGREQTLLDQVDKPFFNPLEMAVPSADVLAKKLQTSVYAPLFQQAYGSAVFASTDSTMAAMKEALRSYQFGPEFAPFSSKYDAYLRGETPLSKQEQLGLELFEAEDKGNCAACHPSAQSADGTPPMFTDYTYDNLGLPASPSLPFLAMSAKYNPAGMDYRDPGLGANRHIFDREAQLGKFKVSTLRNIGATAPYMHNGSMQTLREVLDFYNERDQDPRWSPAEFPTTMNTEELGELNLSEREIEAIIAFLQALTDGYAKASPQP